MKEPPHRLSQALYAWAFRSREDDPHFQSMANRYSQALGLKNDEEEKCPSPIGRGGADGMLTFGEHGVDRTKTSARTRPCRRSELRLWNKAMWVTKRYQPFQRWEINTSDSILLPKQAHLFPSRRRCKSYGLACLDHRTLRSQMKMQLAGGDYLMLGGLALARILRIISAFFVRYEVFEMSLESRRQLHVVAHSCACRQQSYPTRKDSHEMKASHPEWGT